MTAERWQRVKDILYDALEQPGPLRVQYVRDAAGGDDSIISEVLSLMEASDSATGFLEKPALDPDRQAPVDADLGTRLGRYKLIEEIGHGGMGAVYRAVRDDDEFEQEVAIKLIRQGMDSGAFRTRFLYERQLHAFLNHPNIARLLDGGTTGDGRPYFVMEFINGSGINEYCRAHQLSINRRVALFRDVCAAVAYAHRNLIVHRDLKPSNIMITPEGELKLLDFGIAKLLLPDHPGLAASQTSEMQRVLTPDYASPEQVRGDPLTTATDVYSLGLVLYEVLTERKAQPISARSPAELERAVCDNEPMRPARIDRELAGDLENIILKAIDKDPARRYTSVEQLSEDLRRYLEGRPVRARGSSATYRFVKLVRRNLAASIAIVGVLITLIGGIITTTRQARIAERRFNDVRKLANAFLIEHDALAAIPGSTAQRAKLMGESLAYLDALSRESSGDRQLQRELAQAYEKMGDINAGSGTANIGNTAEALSSYRKAVAIREELHKEEDAADTERDLTEAYLKLAAALKLYGRATESLEYEKKALASREEILEREPANLPARRLVAASLQAIGLSLSEMGRDDDALVYRRRALAEYQIILDKGSKLEADYRGLALAHTRIGSVLSRQNKYPASAEAYQRSLAVAREGIEAFPRSVVLRVSETVALRGLSTDEARAGKLEDSLAHARQANFVLSRLAADDPNDWRTHSMLATSHFEIALMLTRAGDRSAALQAHQTALAMRQDLSQKDVANAGARIEVAQSLLELARIQGNDQRALERARQILLEIEHSGRLNSEGRKTMDEVNELLTK